VLYQFSHGVNANIIVDRFNVRAFTMREYVDIVVDVLIFRISSLVDIFLYLMVHIYLGLWMYFFHACSLPNVCGAIHESHILLSQKANKWVTTILADYYFRWKSCNFIVL
jgi:hypothetical protein